MFLLAILHCAVFAIAAEDGVFDQTVVHSVHPNKLYNRELLNKPAKIIYNFEQTRRDQPPQIEQREESIGQYINRRPQFTTTTPVPLIPKFNGFLPKIPFPALHNPVPPYHQQPWSHTSAIPSTVPPPPMPKWSDLSEYYRQSPRYHTHELNPVIATPINHLKPYGINQQQPDLSLPWNDPNNQDNRKIGVPKKSKDLYLNTAVDLTTTMKPIKSSVNHYKAGQDFPVIPQSTNSRGSHKFSTNDVASDPQKGYYSAPVASVNRGPPRATPTLSPWIDGFGK